MITMGDEYGHTKGGNNNTYCHDNYVIPLHLAYLCASMKSIIDCLLIAAMLQLNYFQWDKREQSSSDFFRFCCLMTKFRQ